VTQAPCTSNVCPPDLPAPPAGWVPAAEAAAAMGISARAVGRRCSTGELPGRLCAGTFGPTWYVNSALVPALRISRGDVGAPVASDGVLAGLSRDQRDRAYRRFEAVRDWHADLAARPAGVGVDEFAAAWCDVYRRRTGLAVSRTSILRWVAAVRAKGIAGLVDRRGRPTGRGWSPEAMEFVVDQYCDESRPHARVCWERAAALAASQGWTMPSLRTARAWLQKNVDAKLIVAGRDPRRFRDRCVPDISRDWSLVPAMGLWVADHRQIDVFVPCPEVRKDKDGHSVQGWAWRRPWLTMFLDGRSWYPVGWDLRFESPDSQQVMSVFCKAVIEHGKPAHAYLDNGKDFRARRFAGGRPGRREAPEMTAFQPMLELLGIPVTWATPYNARAKVIEPWFRLMSEWFDRAFETYCGNRQDRKPERLKALAHKAGEFAGRGFDLEAVKRALHGWITNDYALRECPVAASKPLSAVEAFRDLRAEDFRAVRPPAQDLALLLMPSKPVVVGKNGIHVAAFGRSYWSDDLEDRRCSSGRDERRKIVYRYRDDDASQIYVFDARTGKFLAIAAPYVGDGMHPLATAGTAESDAVGEAIALQRRLARDMRGTLAEARKHHHELLLAAQHGGARATGRLAGPAAPPPLPPVVLTITPELSAAAEAGRAASQRRRTETSAAAFFARATGTDDERAGETPHRRGASAAEILAARYAAENDGDFTAEPFGGELRAEPGAKDAEKRRDGLGGEVPAKSPSPSAFSASSAVNPPEQEPTHDDGDSGGG